MELTGVFSESAWMNGYTYTFTVSSAKTAKKDVEVTSIIGKHQTKKSNADVIAVLIQDIDLKAILKGLHKYFPNLRNLLMQRCQIAAVSKADLDGLENLVCLHLGNNFIKKLPNNLLVNMKNLHYLYLMGNQITHLSPKFLDPLDNAKCRFIDLRNNPSINDFFSDLSNHGSVKTLKEAIAESCTATLEMKSNTVAADLMKNLLSTKLMSDFTIKVGEAEFKVHKNILAASSATFRTMFEHEFEETRTNVMTIRDHTKKAVEDFIRFVYTGEIETEENAMELYELSVLYHIPELKDLCEEIVAENLTESNALEVFNMGELHSLDRLKKAAVRQITAAFPDKDLDAEMLCDPTEFNNLVKAKRQLDSVLEHLKRH